LVERERGRFVCTCFWVILLVMLVGSLGSVSVADNL
jgi:hypothetical protein